MRRSWMTLAVAVALITAGCDHAAVRPPSDGEERPPPSSIAPATPQGALPSACPRVAARPVRDQPGARRVTVTARERQTMTGWGASVVSDTYIDPLVQTRGLTAAQVRELDRRVFGQAGVQLVRVFGPGYGRARVEAPPAERAGDRALAFMRRVAPYGVRFMYTGADAPPALKQGRRLRRGAEGAYAAYVAGYLQTARDLGAGFSFAAIANEPDNPASRLQMSPTQSALVYIALEQEIRRRNLNVRLVLGDTTGWGSACPYALAQTAVPALRSSSQAVATHSYFGSPAQARSLGEQARRSGLELWQTEYGTGCARCPDTGGIHEAVTWSGQIGIALDAGGASAWFAFRAVADSTHGPGDALLVRHRRDRRRPFYASKRFHVFRQYSSAGRPGARVLEVQEQVPGVFAVAFRDRARTSVVVTNAHPRGLRRIELDLGTRSGPVTVLRTSGREDARELAPLRYAGRPLVVDLPPESVTSFTLPG